MTCPVRSGNMCIEFVPLAIARPLPELTFPPARNIWAIRAGSICDDGNGYRVRCLILSSTSQRQVLSSGMKTYKHLPINEL